MFSGMATHCSAKRSSAATGVNVVPVRRSSPVAALPKRGQAAYLSAVRTLGGAGERVGELGISSFAAAAVLPDGRVATAVKVGTSQPENMGQRHLNLLTAIVAAALLDPHRIRSVLARRDLARKTYLSVAGGPEEFVRALPESALAAFEVR